MIKVHKNIKSNPLVQVMFFLSALFTMTLTGCTTVAKKPLKHKEASILQTNKVTINNSISQREKLLELLVRSYSVQKFIDVIVKGQKQNNKEFTSAYNKCSSSSKSLTLANDYVKKRFSNQIKSLNNQEVTSYLAFMQSGGKSLVKKLVERGYEHANAKLNGKEISRANHLLWAKNNLNENDLLAYQKLKRLPNPKVKESIFLVTQSKSKSARSLEYNLSLRLVIHDNCKQYINQR